jgi:hypothetical protein
MENVTAQDRYNSFIDSDIKLLKEYGDDYFNSGQGLFGTRGPVGMLKQEVFGDFGQGQRLLRDLQKTRGEMRSNETDEELLKLINTRFKEEDLPYTLSNKLLGRKKKAKGELVGKQTKLDVDGDKDIDADDFAMLRKQKNTGGLLGLTGIYLGFKGYYDVKRAEQELKTYLNENNKGNAFSSLKDYKDVEFSPEAEKILKDAYGSNKMYVYDNKTNKIGPSEKYKKFLNKEKKVLNFFGLEEKRNEKQEGGSIDDQMQMAMGMTEEPQMMEENTSMLPDEVMEDNYLDFIIDEALTEDEESMLMSKLEQDEQLSMLFDKVLEVASEFAGSGPVEGPGSGVSDSIPARLSDGEFVFTAKATEEIGADELMRMMKDAEAAADKRQGMAHGGTHMDSGEEQILSDIARPQVVNQGTNVLEEDEMSKTIKDNMVNPNVQNDYVRS